VGDVPEVAVAGVDLGAAGFDLDAMRFSVVEAIFAGDERPLAPGSDDLELGCECLEGVLEADLIITLSRTAVGKGGGAFFEGDQDLVLGDDGPSDGGAEQVLVLIDGAGADSGEDVLVEELFAEVLDDDFLCAGGVGLGDDRVDVFALAYIGDKGDDVVAVVFVEPRNDDRSVESTGVCENNFFCHERILFVLRVCERVS